MIQANPSLDNVIRLNSLEAPSREGFLRLDMNESASGLPEDFLKSVLARISPESLAMYPEYKTLTERIAAHNGLPLKHFSLTNGSDAAIKYIFDAYVSVGDRVVLTNPTFAMYPLYCSMHQASLIQVEYKPDFSFPLEEFLSQLKPQVRLAIIVNPNNPTGISLAEDDLMQVADQAAKHGILLIIDEAYFYFYPHTFIQAVASKDNVIVLRTFSKLCALAALRVGYAAAAPKIIECINKVKPTYDVNGIGVLFALALLEKEDIIQSLISEVNQGREYLCRRLSEAGISHKPGQANFILIHSPGRVGEIKKQLYQKGILVQGEFSQPLLKDYLRVTLGKPQIMERFWQEFKKLQHA